MKSAGSREHGSTGQHQEAALKLTKTFFEDIHRFIYSARTTIARGADLVQANTNFEIGRRIVQQEQKGKGWAAYGQEVIKELAERLTEEFGNGFSKSNLEYMRRFFLEYGIRSQITQIPSRQCAPTIGIILCRQKNKAFVVLTLSKDANIHASEYQLYLPSKELLQSKLIEWAQEVEE